MDGPGVEVAAHGGLEEGKEMQGESKDGDHSYWCFCDWEHETRLGDKGSDVCLYKGDSRSSIKRQAKVGGIGIKFETATMGFGTWDFIQWVR